MTPADLAPVAQRDADLILGRLFPVPTSDPDMVAFLTPHEMTPDDQSWARSAFCWAIRCDFTPMFASITHLPDGAIRDVRLALCILDTALKVEQQTRVAAAVLQPDLEMSK